MLDGPAARQILTMQRRLSQMRAPLIEMRDDPNSGALGQQVVAAGADLVAAFGALEAALRAVTPVGQGFAGP